MSEIKLEGCINLSKIPKQLIKKNKNGESVIWVKILPNYNDQPDKYGNTHTMTLYDAENHKAIYLANFKPWEQSQQSAPAQPQQREPQENDLPW